MLSWAGAFGLNRPVNGARACEHLQTKFEGATRRGDNSSLANTSKQSLKAPPDLETIAVVLVCRAHPTAGAQRGAIGLVWAVVLSSCLGRFRRVGARFL